MLRRSMAAILWLSLGPHAAVAAECVVDHSDFVFGGDYQKHMTARSGQPCTHGFNIRGGGISSMVVSQPAQHGTAAVSGIHKWGYKSVAGYVGPDTFVITIAGEVMGRRVQSGQTRISVDVNVVR